MLILSVIVDEEYISCLGEEENKWVVVSFLAVYAHAAVVGFYIITEPIDPVMSDIEDMVLMTKNDETNRQTDF
jgi:predicted Co/Zn/Cd cation transporter (cation efflux family)